MRRLTTYYFFILLLINFVILRVVTWFNPIIMRNWGGATEVSLPRLSVWAIQIQYVFYITTFLSFVFLMISIMNKLTERTLSIIAFVILLIDVVCLMVTSFGYPLPTMYFDPAVIP